MGLQTFGITQDYVRRHYFPTMIGFTSASTPTDATVTENINARAGELCAALLKKSVNPDIVSGLTGQNPNYPISYAWCQKTLALAAAVDTLDQLRQGQAESRNQKSAWQSEVAARLKDLDLHGWMALGDAPKPATSATGPRDFIQQNNLVNRNANVMSDVTPAFQADDLL